MEFVQIKHRVRENEVLSGGVRAILRSGLILENIRRMFLLSVWVTGTMYMNFLWKTFFECSRESDHGSVVQSVASLTSSLRVISLNVLADSIYNILIFFAEKNVSSFALQKLLTYFQPKKKTKKQHICVSLNVNFNESLTNDVVSFEQLGPYCRIAPTPPERALSSKYSALYLKKKIHPV